MVVPSATTWSQPACTKTIADFGGWFSTSALAAYCGSVLERRSPKYLLVNPEMNSATKKHRLAGLAASFSLPISSAKAFELSCMTLPVEHSTDDRKWNERPSQKPFLSTRMPSHRKVQAVCGCNPSCWIA